ncbi:MAG: hypothetical protein ABIP55_08540, partial [Tepidisphaeraceae bacterium]
MCLAFLAPLARAHDPLLDLPPPITIPEAWNVIHASIANIDKCLDAGLFREVSFHVANCSPALRTLQENLAKDDSLRARHDELEAMYTVGGAVIEATREKENSALKGRARYEIFKQRWAQIASHYKPAELNADVYVCPMHPLDRHLDKDARCTQCSMSLLRRRIPASVVYEKPGAPSMILTAIPDAPLTPSRAAKVTVQLSRLADNSPVAVDDLLVMHEQRIHLLIVDKTLLDYHHQHPTPTKTPGEFAFSFTPRRPGPYRIWADVVPDQTSVQEFVVADIPGETASATPPKLPERDDSFTDTVDGLRFALAFEKNDLPLLPTKVARAKITLTDPAGKPFKSLEPIMGAYAHLVGFHEDYQTIVHLHPSGPEPKQKLDRGGPTLDFKFYPPKPGFYRFYAQVHVEGRDRFARF